MRRLRTRFWLETLVAAINATLVLFTLLVPDWLEQFTDVDEDAGDGSIERWAVAVFAVVSVGAVILARREWRRAVAAMGAPDIARDRGGAAR